MSPPDIIEAKQPAPSQELPVSGPTSPLRPPTYQQNGQKERRNPSITPRRFTRFFTPISRSSTGLSSARKALHDITAQNVRVHSTSLRPLCLNEEENDATLSRDLKRRKLIHTPDSTPGFSQSRRSRRRRSSLSITEGMADEDLETNYLPSSPCVRAVDNQIYEDVEEEDEIEDVIPKRPKPLTSITPMYDRGLSARLLQLSSGSCLKASRTYHSIPAADWRSETASFYTRPADVQMCMSTTRPGRSIPFCTAGLNTNSLVAIGDEDGCVQLVESELGGGHEFKNTFLSFGIHSNAIIDMVFSGDDSRLATASGDQSARVVDMTTQTTISVLLSHTASLKQIRFQPGANDKNVLATSSRDGTIQLWDLRCNQGNHGALHVHPPITENASNCYNIGSISGAHRPTYHTRQSQKLVSNDKPSRDEQPGRIGEVSVTALSFLAPGQEHFLLTGSEADASIKLWDIRSLQNRRKIPCPISSTRQPQSHSQFRHFGINSINLSTDGSKIYSLCKDNSIYAYSTAHLILGHAPELSSNQSARSAPQRPIQEGLGPIYAFRHPQLHAASFYVKSVLRRARNGHSELLAVGSTDGCAILFPTDERYFPSSSPKLNPPESSNTPTLSSQSRSRPRPALSRTGSNLSLSRLEDPIPISQNGTPLIRGHDREVGALTWTANGDLVTLGDDFLVRCWREDGDQARDLRTGGESGGRRWACGWADVGEGWDDDDEC